MGCVFSEVATWISEGMPKLLEYRRQRKLEILEKSKVSEDCFHYGWEVLETVAQFHSQIMENGRTNDYITPSVIRRLVEGMIRPDPALRGQAPYHLESSASILKEARDNLKRALPRSPAPNPDHTVSDTHVDVRKPRLPPNLPPGQEHQEPTRPSGLGKKVPRPLQAAELHNSPPRSIRQDLNRLQQGPPVRNLGDYGNQQGGEPFGMHSDYFAAQNEETYAYRPSQRIVSHPAASRVQSQQNARSFTSTAGISSVFPNNRPLGASVDAYDATDTSILPQRPRDYRATNNDLSAPRAELNDELSEFANSERAHLANSIHTSFHDHPLTVSDTHISSPVGRQSGPHRRPHPTMSVAEGLKIKKAKRSSRAQYPGEDAFHTTDDILKKRDHVRESIIYSLSS